MGGVLGNLLSGAAAADARGHRGNVLSPSCSCPTARPAEQARGDCRWCPPIAKAGTAAKEEEVEEAARNGEQIGIGTRGVWGREESGTTAAIACAATGERSTTGCAALGDAAGRETGCWTLCAPIKDDNSSRLCELLTCTDEADVGASTVPESILEATPLVGGVDAVEECIRRTAGANRRPWPSGRSQAGGRTMVAKRIAV